MNRTVQRQEKINLKTKADGQAFILKLAEGFQKRQILLLQGAMGSGKTQFVSWLAGHYASDNAFSGDIASPTYAFHHRYKGEHGHIEHFDLDRIQSESDLESIGFWDIFANETGWVIIEWPERINIRHLPKSWALTHLKIERANSTAESEARVIELTVY